MKFRASALRVLLLSLLVLALTPAVSHAWQVTVYVHGAGVVDETTSRNLMYCGDGLLDNISESSQTTCTAGSPTGGYGHGDIVNLNAFVTQAQYDRGWRFSRWVEGTGTGQVDCDPQGDPVSHYDADCRFQIWENLSIHLYFDDVAAPDTTALDGSPGSGVRTNSTSASFTFDASEGDARFDCKLDRPGDPGAWEACGSPWDKGESYSQLTANGTYTFSVRARDLSGNADGTPRSRSWVVDTVAPTASITSGPSGTVKETIATFGFSSMDGGTEFLCSLDGSPYTGCSTGQSYPGLTDGSHTFAVRARDEAGNVGGPTARSWTVDTTKPVTAITGGPSGESSSASGEFTFSASEDVGFWCKLDAAEAAPCESPYAFAGLSDGEHTFTVYAVDGVGHTGDQVTRTWTIDRTAPDTSLTGGPSEGATVSTASATFEFSSADSGAAFECRLDTEAFAPCSSPYTRNAIANGEHVFEVRARDAAGNVDATPARRSWVVNSLDTDGDGFNRPQDCDDSTAAVHPGASDVPDNGVDEDCSGADSLDLDRDRDGAARPLDCNDDDAAIRPGAPDAPRDGVDQDCDGHDAEYALADGALRHQWIHRGTRTRAKALRLSDLTPGSTLQIRCKGRGCPFKARRVKPSSEGVVDVRRLLKKRWLRAGARLKIRVTAPGMAGRVIAFKMRRGKAPAGGKLACTAPGSTERISCPAT